MKKLHLGCGLRHIPGWTHIDLAKHAHVDLVADVRDLSILQEGKADVIYACHVLEHCYMSQVPTVLAKWRRLLRPGGTLRLSVPDFSVLAALFLEKRVALPVIAGPLLGGQKGDHDAHLSVFDWDTLSTLLQLARFVDIRRYDPALTEHAEVDDYSRAEFDGALISLNVEATRP